MTYAGLLSLDSTYSPCIKWRRFRRNKATLTSNNQKEVKILLLKCIEGVATNKSLVPDITHYNLVQKLCELFNFTKDKVTRLIAIKLLVTI